MRGGGVPAQWRGPLADVLGERIRYGANITSVSRLGRDRVVDAGRGEQPFTVHVAYSDGTEARIIARAVVDASGTWTTPSPIGGDGLPAFGERAAAALILTSAHRDVAVTGAHLRSSKRWPALPESLRGKRITVSTNRARRVILVSGSAVLAYRPWGD